MNLLFSRICFSICVSAFSVLTYAQSPGKSIGFGVQVSTEGLFSTTVAKVVVTVVLPGSQAEAGGLTIGDELVKIQGIQVPGGSALELKPHMEFQLGVPKTLVFRRSAGSEYQVVFTRERAK